jgi:DNA-binding transcriptional ArsR family regulator
MTTVAEPTTAPALDYRILGRLCKAAGDPLRLEILRALRRDAYGVLELCQIFAVPQPSMSHHLKVLAAAGLVIRRREGTSIFYSRARAGSGELKYALFAATDSLSISEQTLRGVELVQADRAAAAREFFAVYGQAMRAQQELIAPRAQYQQALQELLLSVVPARVSLTLELGPGDGWLLPTLAARSERVIATDNSAEMLEQSRRTCVQHGLDNVDLVLADSSHARTLGPRADIAVMNMVLHHTPSPANVMRDMSRALRPGGVLLISDLCSHDQSWASETCGDLWLGFEPEDLGNWARDAGLTEGDSTYLALRNGFRLQLRTFHQC